MDTREQWLQAAVEGLRDIFRMKTGVTVPTCRVSVGFGFVTPRKRLGECWSSKNASDGVNHVFISPMVDDFMVVSILAHELCHVVDDCKSGHTKYFAKLAKDVGLIPNPQASTRSYRFTLPGPDLFEEIKALISELPPYPHVQLRIAEDEKAKKQPTRMIKLACACGYTIRTAQKWIDTGLPTCACGASFEQA